MVFKLYERDTAQALSEPSVTIQKRGLIPLNPAGAEQPGNPAAAQLYFDEDWNIIGSKAAKSGAPHSFRTRRQATAKKGKVKNRGTMLSGRQIFTKRIGLDTTQARRFTPRMDDEGDMLTVDLKQEGQPATSSRSRGTQTSLSV